MIIIIGFFILKGKRDVFVNVKREISNSHLSKGKIDV